MNFLTLPSLIILTIAPLIQAADILLVTEDIAVPTTVGPIAGVDFENNSNTAFNRTPDDLNPNDGITVSFDWEGSLNVLEDNGAQVAPTSGSSTAEIDQGSSLTSLPNVAPTTGHASWSITIPDSVTLNLSNITFDWRQGTSNPSQTRWGIFNTSIDGGPGGSIAWSIENPPIRPIWENVSVDLSGPAYQGLTNTTVTFYWYTERTGSDIDTIVLSGSSVGNDGYDNGETRSLNDFLEAEGHVVTREERTNGPGDVSAFDLIIVSRETSSPRYDEGTEPTDWNGLGLPLINMAPHLMRSIRWGWVNGNTLPSSTLSSYDTPFVNSSHPIVQSATASILSPAQSSTGVSNSLPAGTEQIVTMANGSSHGIFVIPPGASFFGGSGTAGDVRIGFIRGNSGSWDHATANGELLLRNTINWALGTVTGPPTIDNNPASLISSNAATVGGEVTDTGGSIPNVTIYYGESDGGTDPNAWDESLNLGGQSSTFSTGLTGLNPATTYYFRSFALNASGEDWADSSESFITLAPPSLPTIVNNDATAISFTSAELNGEVTSTGGETPSVIIYWGLTDGGINPLAWEQSIEIGLQSGSFTREIPGLSNNTNYFFRSSATNSNGTAWAPATDSFTTLAFTLPIITNGSSQQITGTSAEIIGQVIDTGGNAPLITIYFGLSDGGTDPSAWDNSLSAGEQSGTFSEFLTGLLPFTQYHFRIFAINEAGETWASQSNTFTTSNLGPLVINEFLASNDGTYSQYPEPNQVAGLTDDWIEILNISGAPIDLDGWHLTDDDSDLTQWSFPPETILAAGEFLLVYASGDGVPDANGNLHTNFRLGAGGEYVALVGPDLSVASGFNADGTDYPPQETDVSYGIHPFTASPVFFAEPTPGNPNDPNGLDRVQDTRFDIDRGIYNAPFDVTITTATQQATIYYSTDGNPPIDAAGNPTPSALLYLAPVNISQTTILRAAAVMEGFEPTNIDTQSYILIDVTGAGPDGLDPGGLNAKILEQTAPTGFPSLSSGDYEMDQRISKSTDQAEGFPAGTSEAQALIQGLVDIPTLSIAMDFDDFAGPSNGIYTNSTQSGFAWERVCSAELIQGDNSEAWQENCGIRVQGGASRGPTRSPKHSLSLRFRDLYGAGRLRENIFPESEVDNFNSLAIRAVYNNSWIHSNVLQRNRASLIRDQWARSTMLDMGHTEAGQGLMVNLYINGLYWGVHNLTERQDSSHYAEHNGGDDDLLDARNGSTLVDGNATAWNSMVDVVNNGDWNEIQQVLDVDNHIDYQILNRYGGNSDLAPLNNWRAAGGGPFPAGQPELMAPWQLYAWDSERTLEDESTDFQPVDPAEIRTTLLTYPEYRIRFADRLQKHFTNDGALTAGQAKGRWLDWAGVLDRSIIAESARWGDHRGNLYDRDDEWLTEQDRLCSSYFPVRSTNVLQHYQDDGIFPTSEVPVFHVNGSPQHGGPIPTENSLSLIASSGTIYYTLDGSDPRAIGGAVNPSATSVVSGEAIFLNQSSLVRTRTLNSGEWSALNEAVFFLGTQASANNLVISEIMYNPPGDSEEEEYLVLMNINSSETIDLSGVLFNDGINYSFPLGTLLAPLERIVITTNQTAFAAAYDSTGFTIAEGEFTGELANSGEVIGLITSEGEDIRRFFYDDNPPWPLNADGLGSSLVLINPTENPDHSLAANWQDNIALQIADYDLWNNNYPNVNLSDPAGDYDGDGLTNAEERLWGLDPTSSSSLNPLSFPSNFDGTFSYTRRDPDLSGAIYTIWTSTDLTLWLIDAGATQVASTPDALGVQTVLVTPTALPLDGRLFFRVQAVE